MISLESIKNGHRCDPQWALVVFLLSDDPERVSMTFTLTIAMLDDEGKATLLNSEMIHPRIRAVLQGVRDPRRLAAAQIESLICAHLRDDDYTAQLHTYKEKSIADQEYLAAELLTRAIDGDDKALRRFFDWASKPRSQEELESGPCDDELKDFLQ